jgi:hypothetical protein
VRSGVRTFITARIPPRHVETKIKGTCHSPKKNSKPIPNLEKPRCRMKIFQVAIHATDTNSMQYENNDLLVYEMSLDMETD